MAILAMSLPAGQAGRGAILALPWLGKPTGWETAAIDGNSQTRTHDNANQITSISGLTYAPLYDEAGNNVRGPRPAQGPQGPADANANNAAHFRYDAWNRLATVRLDDGNTPGTLDPNDSLLATYRYDGLNRRVKKVSAVDGNSVADYVYHNENWQIVEVRRGVNAAPASTAYKQYAWDLRYIDAPICRWWDADSDGQIEPASGEMQYFTNDGNFNTTALIDANSGQVVERYQYDPYGKVTVLNGATGAEKDPNVTEWTPDADNKSDWDNDVLYCGYQYDPVTGLYHVRERYYDPATGTWKTRDPLGYADGMSLYAYMDSDVVGFSDPLGLERIDNKKFSKEFKPGACFQFIELRYHATADDANRSATAHWELEFIRMPYDSPVAADRKGGHCFCCPDGSPAAIKFKQILNVVYIRSVWQETAIKLANIQKYGNNLIKHEHRTAHSGLDHIDASRGGAAGRGNQPPWNPYVIGYLPGMIEAKNVNAPIGVTEVQSDSTTKIVDNPDAPYRFVLTDDPAFLLDSVKVGYMTAANRQLLNEYMHNLQRRAGRGQLKKEDAAKLTAERERALTSWTKAVNTQRGRAEFNFTVEAWRSCRREEDNQLLEKVEFGFDFAWPNDAQGNWYFWHPTSPEQRTQSQAN